MKILMLVILALTLASVAEADMTFAPTVPMAMGGLVGNGGGTVVCRKPNHSIKSVEVLDLYEARTLRNVNTDLQKMPGDWQAKAKAVIARIEAKSELRFQLYSLWLSTFQQEYKILQNIQMSTVPDAGYIGVPEGCDFEQAAIQRAPMFTGDARYYINAELWTAMDDTQKAALVLHEIFYREAIGYGQTDSIRSRFMTGLYTSADFATQTLNAYWSVLEQAEYELTDAPAPDSLKASVTTTFDPTRLWQLGTATNPESISPITLDGRFIVKIGDCSNGCQTYTPAQFSQGYVLPGDYVQFALGKDISDFKIGTNFINSVPATTSVRSGIVSTTSGNSLAGVFFHISVPADQTASVNLSSTLANSFTVFDDSGRGVFGAVTFQMNRDSSGNWTWVHAVTSSAFSKLIPVPNFGDIVISTADSFNSCVLVELYYVNNQVSTVGSLVSPEASCASTPSTAYASALSNFANNAGAGTYLDPYSNTSIAYSSTMPGAFQELNRDYNVWFSDQAAETGTTVNCVSQNTSSNCLQPTFDANQNIISFNLLTNAEINFARRVPPTDTTSAVNLQAQATAKAGTVVTLFPSGRVNTFVSAVPFQVQQNNQPLEVPANVTVVLDDNTNFVSFH